jgi:hypothetical protein
LPTNDINIITSSKEDAIVVSGIDFLKSITDTYGPEDGMKLWEQIASVLDPSIKGRIFFTLISGNYNTTHLTIKFPSGFVWNDAQISTALKKFAVRLGWVSKNLKI